MGILRVEPARAEQSSSGAGQGSPAPDGAAAAARRAVTLRSVALTVVAVLVTLHAVAVARPLLLPIVLASLAAFVLAPFVSGLRRLGMPRPLAAALVIALGLGALGYGASTLAAPATEWLDRAPQSLSEIERKLRVLKRPLERLSKTTQRVEEAAVVGSEPARTVAVRESSLGGALAEQVQALLVNGAAVAILTYFLLASGHTLYRRLAAPFRRLEDRRRTLRIAREIETQVSRHLVTITAINAVLAFAIGAAFLLLGLPNPFLWGVMAGVLNFVPYLGAVISTGIVAAVALLSFSDPWQAVLVPLTLMAITSVEGMIVTPIVVGRRLLLHPIAILGAVFLWTFLWGTAGALVAVPLAVVFRIVCEHVPALHRVGRLLER